MRHAPPAARIRDIRSQSRGGSCRKRPSPRSKETQPWPYRTRLPITWSTLVAERFRALSEPTRIRLLDRLREGEASVLELSDLIGTSPQNVSKHLGVLQQAGIVACRKQRNFVYRIVDEGVLALCGSIQQQVEPLRQLVGEGLRDA
jgi:DNA-binding transcriptional ArsR family regulator